MDDGCGKMDDECRNAEAVGCREIFRTMLNKITRMT